MKAHTVDGVGDELSDKTYQTSFFWSTQTIVPFTLYITCVTQAPLIAVAKLQWVFLRLSRTRHVVRSPPAWDRGTPGRPRSCPQTPSPWPRPPSVSFSGLSLPPGSEVWKTKAVQGHTRLLLIHFKSFRPNFRRILSYDRQIVCSLETWIDEFWDRYIVNCFGQVTPRNFRVSIIRSSRFLNSIKFVIWRMLRLWNCKTFGRVPNYSTDL